MYADDASSGVHGSSYVFISRFNYCVSSRPICLPRSDRFRYDVSFVFENFIDGDQDAGLFHLPELMVDSGAEYTHFRGEAHISIDQRRHIDAELADFLVQDLVIVLEVVILEKLLHFFWIRACFQWADRSDQFLRVGEVHVQKIQDHVAGFGIIGVIHRYLPEVILQAGVHHGKSSQAIPKIVQYEQSFCAATTGRLVF